MKKIILTLFTAILASISSWADTVTVNVTYPDAVYYCMTWYGMAYGSSGNLTDTTNEVPDVYSDYIMYFKVLDGYSLVNVNYAYTVNGTPKSVDYSTVESSGKYEGSVKVAIAPNAKNQIITINIEKASQEASITISEDQITCTTSSSGAVINVPVSAVISEGLAEDAELAVYYALKPDGAAEAEYMTAELSDGYYVCTFSDLEPSAEYTAQIYAATVSGEVESDVVEVAFTTEAAQPVIVLTSVLSENVMAESADIVAEFTTEYLPEGASVFAVVSYMDGDTEKTVMGEPVENGATSTTVSLTDLTAETTYNISVVIKAENAEGLQIAESETKTVSVSMPSSGLITVSADSSTSSRYFDLSGKEVKNVDSGIYIRISDGQASKVMVK